MKAGLFAIAGSVVALHGHHARRDNYYYDPVISSVKSSSSPSVYYDYDYPSSSSTKSKTIPIATGLPDVTEKISSHSMNHTMSGSLVAPVEPVETCKATSTKTVVIYVDNYTAPVKAVVPSTSTSYTTVYPITAAPTPVFTIFKTPGTYALPTVTIHLNKTITVIAKKTTSLTSGTNYFGGYTTTVNGSSTITCPYVATETNGAKVTEVVHYTTTVCPSAGVYTPITPTLTVVSTKTVIVYAIPTSYGPGDYTVPAATYTATAYDEVYVCPYEAVANVATVTATHSTSAIKYVYSSSSSTPALSIVPDTSAIKSVYYSSSPSTPALPVVPHTSASVEHLSSFVVASSTNSAKASASAPSIKTNGKKWAMTYTPYNSAGLCKTADEVDADIKIISGKGFTTIRLYATDCSGLINIGASAKKHGLKLILGVFIKAAGIDNARPQLAELATWGGNGNWDMVSMIVIGNEAIFNNYCSASALAAFITEAKKAFAATGYTGPVTTTEPVDKIQSSAGVLCGVIDVVAANIQPFFDSGVKSSEAGTYVVSQLALVAAACPGKTVYNLECGWPSNGSPNGAAIASPADQSAAIADIVDKAGDTSVIFSYDNDAWKVGGTFGVEPYFGCSSLF